MAEINDANAIVRTLSEILNVETNHILRTSKNRRDEAKADAVLQYMISHESADIRPDTPR